ncbi:MAG: ferrous iron transport protein B [Chitinophagaceae bacterium]
MKKFKNIALVGNPNCGKTSLFNALTGLHQRVGNFPGVTVEKKTGRSQLSNNLAVNIVDLPGTYSLYPKSEDEIVAFDVLFDDDESVSIDVIVAVVDASSLKRNLLFCSQLLDIKKPVVIALTMLDIASQKGINIDVHGMSRMLGCPIVPINPRKNKGIQALKKEIETTIEHNFIPPVEDFINLKRLAPELHDIVNKYQKTSSHTASIHFASAYERLSLLSKQQKEQLKEELSSIEFNKAKIQAAETIQRYAKIKKMMQGHVMENSPLQKELLSRKIDNYLLHPLWGNIFLLIILFIMFQMVYWLAQYPMEWIDSIFSWITSQLKNSLPDHFISRLLIDGLLAGINGIVVFVPQIMILFGIISLLEDSGYMSRISFLSDRLMRRVGLNGKSVMPLISATACAVPAIMAARTIENKKEKLITILIAPLMSCSARLPVYTILIGLMVPETKILGIFTWQGIALLAMYFFGFMMSLIVGFALAIFIKVKDKSIFLMEMPVYRWPRWNNVAMTMLQKSKVFVFDAGKIIIIISVMLWILSSYGYKKEMNQSSQFFAQTSLEHSYAGIIGKKIEPAIRPLGFDWKIGIALITSFAAREVFVGTMSTLYSVEDENERTLMQKLKNARRNDGSLVYSLATAMSLLIFYAIAMQCMSTFAIVWRETKSFYYALLQFVLFGTLAYIFSFFVYYIMSH